MARRRGIKLEDLSPEHAAEARRQIAGGGVDAASLAIAAAQGAVVVSRTAGGLVVDRDLKPENVPVDRDLKPANPMNKTEAAYAETLRQRQLAGDVAWFAFGWASLRMAHRTFYRPDFAVLVWRRILEAGPAGTYTNEPRVLVLEFHEVKGWWREDARQKVKLAAEAFPFRFLAVTRRRQKDGGGWDVERFPGAVDRA